MKSAPHRIIKILTRESPTGVKQFVARRSSLVARQRKNKDLICFIRGSFPPLGVLSHGVKNTLKEGKRQRKINLLFTIGN